jgi:uncharacterized membrane protein
MNQSLSLTKSFLKKNKWTLFMFLVMGLVVYLMPEASVQAQMFEQTRDLPENINIAGGGTTLREIILLAINFILGFVGLIAVIMVIYGGFRLLTSAGEEEDTKTAKNVILYAVIGIIIILFSFAIVNTLFDITTGQDTTV